MNTTPVPKNQAYTVTYALEVDPTTRRAIYFETSDDPWEFYYSTHWRTNHTRARIFCGKNEIF